MRKYELKKKDTVISEENASEQLMMFFERYDIDIYSYEEDLQKEFIKTADQVVKFISQGRLEIAEVDAEIKVTLHIQNQSKNSTVPKLVFGEVQGKHKAQMKQDVSEHKKISQLMGAVCETPGGHSAVEQLRSSDRRVLEAIAGFFL